MHRGRPPSTNSVRSDASYIVDGSPLRKSTARNYRRYGHSPEPWHGIGDPRKRTTPTFTPSLTPDNDHCNVKVAVRLRPDPNAHRNQIPSKKCVSVDNTCTSVTVDQMGLSVMQDILVQPRTFKFDYVADENVDQGRFRIKNPITVLGQGWHNADLAGFPKGPQTPCQRLVKWCSLVNSHVCFLLDGIVIA
eukprot:Gb_25907 [translate_table: standard]